jgi:AcrR family transcriptional regulator
MARRNDHSKDEIREMVVSSGLDLIKKSGFSSFSTRQIAKEIGYTVGTLYNVFDSYDDIILHINAATLDEMEKFIEMKINPKLKGVKAVKQLAKLYIEFAHNNRSSWSALFEKAVPLEAELPDWYNQKIAKLFSIVESILLEFISKKSDAKKHAKVIWASIHGICILGLTQKLNVVGSDSTEVLVDCMIENYLRGIND